MPRYIKKRIRNPIQNLRYHEVAEFFLSLGYKRGKDHTNDEWGYVLFYPGSTIEIHLIPGENGILAKGSRVYFSGPNFRLSEINKIEIMAEQVKEDYKKVLKDLEKLQKL